MPLPLPPKQLNLTAGWKYSSGGIHAGFDYGVDIGTPLFAVRRGKVLAVRDTIPDMGRDENGQSGDPANFVMLGITFRRQPATFLYLHIKQGSAQFEVGDEVEAGALVARSGHNGNSSGPHLHVAVMRGHDHSNPFDYLSGLSDSSPQPTNGVAGNGITIYPPSLVYSRQRTDRFAGGEVRVAELTFGTRDSDSVRRLQYRLNQIPLVGGTELKITGNYTAKVRDEVTKWQVQKRGFKPGTPMADGNVRPLQAKVLFGSRYTLV